MNTKNDNNNIYLAKVNTYYKTINILKEAMCKAFTWLCEEYFMEIEIEF